MWGNSLVRFLGEGMMATSFPLPDPGARGGRMVQSCVIWNSIVWSTYCPIDWLRRLPTGFAPISRDRASGFAEGARAGAPHAIQAARRWHVLRNLAETLELLVRHHRSQRTPQAKVDTHQGQETRAAGPQARLTPAQQHRRYASTSPVSAGSCPVRTGLESASDRTRSGY
jgi:hypothetical protein